MQRCLSAVIDCGEPKTLLNGGFEFVSGFHNQYQSVIKYRCNHPFYALLGGNEGEIFLFSSPFSLKPLTLTPNPNPRVPCPAPQLISPVTPTEVGDPSMT